ncbi:hypothetical protein MIND_00837300 [Mycena indigotica]|uniref:Uncharacterized protein n=1 Tax=Mycena indigotica TaxID=2126181 RepID=A0A8H6W252_9AGAR|nr:uncharacterized protein MIND_00837300 [Mycena indigotica]KAF7298893.1 hypothetical protein MIND_00837300 [Mycena indigotica]
MATSRAQQLFWEDDALQLCTSCDTTAAHNPPTPTLMTLARAQELCVACATNATLGHAQHTAIAMVELCVAVENTQSRRKPAISMAKLAVQLIAPILQKARDGELPLGDPVVRHVLEDIMTTLGRMRCLVEQHPNFLKGFLESLQLRQQLKKRYKAVMRLSKSHNSTKSSTIIEAVGLSAQVAVAVCDAPVLNAFKPIANMVALFSDRATTVKSNQEAAAALAQHAENVTTNVLKHTALAGGSEGAREVLQSALQDAAFLLDGFSDGRGKWLSANSDSARLASVSAKLDKALAVYMAWEAVETKTVVRRTTAQLSRLVTIVDRIHFEAQHATPSFFFFNDRRQM